MKRKKIWIIPLIVSILSLTIGASFHGYRLHPENAQNYNIGVAMGITMASIGTDARLLDKDAPNNPDGKLNKVAENVFVEYERAKADGRIGCQLIFSDIGTPSAEKDFTVYDYLKQSLIQYGIPEEEIAFIHDAKTDAQRDVLFKEMRAGKQKVLIGSTDKCGTGVNVQTHLVALHHVDCPWKPSSIEQREGRGIRQGNENDEIAVYRYVTKGTFDAYNWSLVENNGATT